jgi:hypothetical protein
MGRRRKGSQAGHWETSQKVRRSERTSGNAAGKQGVDKGCSNYVSVRIADGAHSLEVP